MGPINHGSEVKLNRMAEEVTSGPLTGSDENQTKQEMGGDKGAKDGDRDGRTEDNGEVEGRTTSIKSITGTTEEELLAKLEAQNRYCIVVSWGWT